VLSVSCALSITRKSLLGSVGEDAGTAQRVIFGRDVRLEALRDRGRWVPRRDERALAVFSPNSSISRRPFGFGLMHSAYDARVGLPFCVFARLCAGALRCPCGGTPVRGHLSRALLQTRPSGSGEFTAAGFLASI
jgi:hypothetical protein